MMNDERKPNEIIKNAEEENTEVEESSETIAAAPVGEAQDVAQNGRQPAAAVEGAQDDAVDSQTEQNGVVQAAEESVDDVEAEAIVEDVEAGTEPDPAEIIEQLEQELAAANAKAAEYLDRLQRTAAEFQNSKRRQEKQVAERIERANAHMIQRLLPVLDDFDLAFRNVPDEFNAEENAWLSGFQQIQKKLLHILEEEEVQPMPTEGEFDPNRHEAVSSEPSEEVESGQIIETLRLGYEYKGRVLRPAIVRVAT